MSKASIVSLACSGFLLGAVFLGLFSQAVRTESATASGNTVWSKEEERDLSTAFKQRDAAIEVIVAKVNEHEERLRKLEPKKVIPNGKEEKKK